MMGSERPCENRLVREPLPRLRTAGGCRTGSRRRAMHKPRPGGHISRRRAVGDDSSAGVFPGARVGYGRTRTCLAPECDRLKSEPPLYTALTG
jgi:hypothetical protein